MAHSLYGPSGAKGWMACAGRIALEALVPPRAAGKDADIGTATHAVAAHVLEGLSKDASEHVGNLLPVHAEGDELRRTVKFTDEMAEWAQGYVDSIRSLVEPGDTLYIERFVDYSHIAGIPDQGGTLDAGIVKPRLRELQVHDLKTGRHAVEVERNPQLMIYALGLLNEIELVHDIEHVRLFIHQPKLRQGPIEWACSVDELRAFATKVRNAVQDSEAARREIAETGITDRWALLYLNPEPSEQACAWCRAMPTCPSMQRKVQATTGAAFADLTVADAPKLADPKEFTPVELSRAMDACGLIEDWIKAVRAEVERRLLAGQSVEGWGLELGRQGARKWTDEGSVEQYLSKTVRLNVREMCEVELKSPTQLEKLTKPGKDGKSVIGQRQWAVLERFIGRADARPSVKPAAQIKQPYVVKPLSDDAFSAVGDSESLA